MLKFLKAALLAVFIGVLILVSIPAIVYAVGLGVQALWITIVPDIFVGFVTAGLLPAELELGQSLKLSAAICVVTTMMLSIMRVVLTE